MSASKTVMRSAAVFFLPASNAPALNPRRCERRTTLHIRPRSRHAAAVVSTMDTHASSSLSSKT